MITTTMTAQEILREYKADYEKYLRPRLSSLATRKTHDLKLAKGKWIPVREEIKVETSGRNKYGIRCKMRYDKKRGPGWSSIAYLPVYDSRTGKKVVYLFSDSVLIRFESSFLREIGIPMTNLLGHGASWDIMTGASQDQRYSAWIDFGDDLGAGVGGWEDDVLVLRHHIKTWKNDPLSDFLESRIQEDPNPSEDVTKKNEVDLAWEAYLKGDLE